jgi:hypothetical protein
MTDENAERDSDKLSDDEYDMWEAQFTGCSRGS